MVAKRVGAAVFAAAAVVAVTACQPGPGSGVPNQTAPPPQVSRAPASPPARICGNTSFLAGPASPPAGAIVVPAGDNANVDFRLAGRTYWFAPGVHTLGTGEFGQIIPGDNSTFIGGPGAILDGRDLNRFAFTQQARNVRVAYLTIRNFGRGTADNHQQGVVNHDAGDNWVVERNTVIANDGAGVFVGDGNVVRWNCLKDNGQYGFSVYEEDGVVNVTIDHNEVTGNNKDDWESRIDGCGCSGGAKFWEVNGARATNNWVHGNNGPGLWADYNNRAFLFEGNYFEGNLDEALFYEVSYNATIRFNTFKRNTIRKGQSFAANGDTFPVAAVYISEAGGDVRVAGPPTIDIHSNVFEDNWSGVTVWENADRFCGNGATPGCTLVNRVATEGTCRQPGIASRPLYDDCRWKSNNVQVHHNVFRVTPGNIGCSSYLCSSQAVLSNYGTWPSFSPYRAERVQTAITFQQNNRFFANTYIGPWRFVAFETGRVLTFNQWRAAPYNQDGYSSVS